MRNVVRDKEPQKFQKVIVYNLNSKYTGSIFYLNVIDSNRMWIAEDDPRVIIPVEDNNEWEDLSWLTDGTEAKGYSSITEKNIEVKFQETDTVEFQTF